MIQSAHTFSKDILYAKLTSNSIHNISIYNVSWVETWWMLKKDTWIYLLFIWIMYRPSYMLAHNELPQRRLMLSYYVNKCIIYIFFFTINMIKIDCFPGSISILILSLLVAFLSYMPCSSHGKNWPIDHT